MLNVTLFASDLAPMEMALFLMFAMLVGGSLIVGIYQARKTGRGFLHWVASILAALIGGTIGGMALSFGAMGAVDVFAKSAHAEWPELDATIGLLAMLIGLILGAKLAVSLVSQLLNGVKNKSD